MKLNKEILITISSVLIIVMVSLFFVIGLKVEKENQVRSVILNLEHELMYDFSTFEALQEDYIIHERKVDIALYKKNIDSSFQRIEKDKVMIWKDDMNCDRKSNDLDKRIVFLNNTYNMLKQCEGAVVNSYYAGNYKKFEEILKCVNGHLRESFYDTEKHNS